MDLEGYAKRALIRGDEEILPGLVDRILEIKDISKERAERIANAVITEADATLGLESNFLTFPRSGVSMGDFGVGSRGEGDFYAHEKIAEVIGRTGAVLDSSQQDDAGAVRLNDDSYLVVTVDGMHSRLSDFPFLAGFHVARATLRDVYVMGAIPVALFSDIHVADDGDVAKIFDHIAGISVVSEIMNVPFITGSTLRIGGDMVIGERMTGCVGAVGTAKNLTPRRDAKPGDVILMTEGAGGGTISTTALYYGRPDIVQETLNVKFLHVCDLLVKEGLSEEIHAMTDVTNGGIRGDAQEISKTAQVRLVFREDKLRSLVNLNVMAMLDELDIDYLGVSIDTLLVISTEEVAEKIKSLLSKESILVEEVGYVEEGTGSMILVDGEIRDLSLRFRESAYTPLKKLIDESPEEDFEEMRRRIDEVVHESIRKKHELIQHLHDTDK
ncbi:MAG: AIR synthase-related protein [Halobacteriota archaeon]|nr:AIR synthase-related protein [Halobacteriota archaeon]